MNQCPNCRQETEPESSQCPHCEAALPAGGAGPTPPLPPPPPNPGRDYYQDGSGQTQAGPVLQISEQDWRDFLGSNAGAYLPKFARFSSGGLEAFVATFWWFLYRKLYLWFGLCLVGMFISHLHWVAVVVSLNAFLLLAVVLMFLGELTLDWFLGVSNLR